MKKREITNNDLERMFSKVIEQTPLMNEEQVNTLINNLPKVSTVSSAKQFLQNHLNSLIVGTIVLSIVVVSILWVNIGHKTEKTMIQNNRQESEFIPAPADTIAVNSAVNIGKGMVVQDTTHKVNSLKTSSTKTSSATTQKDTIISVSDIYKHFATHPQIFPVQTNRDTTITCKEGTTIYVKANSFISEKTGKEISGIVQIAVKEYYKISDIILSNLSTTSGNKILETGGMLHLAATADNENCLIKQGREIEIGFPYSNKKDDMVLFNGEWTNDKIDWKLANTTSTANVTDELVIMTEPETVFFIVEELPEFPGGNIGLKKYISENIQYPYSALKDKIEGIVLVSCIIDTKGLPTKISVLRGVNSVLDKSAYYLVRNMPKWKPGRQGGKPVAVSYTIPITFSVKSAELTKEEINQSKDFEKEIINLKVVYKTTKGNFKEEFEDKINDDNLNRTKVSDINRYLFSASQIGWINCDRIYNDKRDKTDYFVQTDESNCVNIQLVFKSIKAILPGLRKSNGFIFTNVPLGEKVTIVALKTVNNKIFLAVKETEITDKEDTVLDFQPVTMDLLKKAIEKLNKFN